MTMVLPDTPERDGPTGFRLPALGAVALVSVITALVLGKFTSPPDPSGAEDPALVVPNPTTTTLFHGPTDLDGFTEQGRPLTWERMAGIGDHRPLAIVELNEEVLVFTTPPATPFGQSGQLSINDPSSYGGLFLWWPFQAEHQGPVARAARVIPPGTLFDTVEVTSFGLLAMGVDLGTGMASYWTSSDGSTWSPFEPHGPTGDRIQISEVHVQDGTTMILASNVATTGWEGWLEARRAARDQFGDATMSMVQLTRDRYAVFGVLGLQLGVIQVGNDHPPRVVVERYLISTSDGIAWEVTEFPDQSAQRVNFLGDMVTAPDGDVWVLAYTFDGPVVYSSHDGSEWTRLDDRSLTRAGGVYARLMAARPWAGSHLTLSLDSQGNTTLVGSEDLVNWGEVLDFATLFTPSPGPHAWSFQTWTAGTQGIAVLAQRTIPVTDVQTDEPGHTVDKDGYTLEVTSHNIRLMGSDADITASRYYSHSHARIRFDLVDRSVVFLDVQGVELVRFTYAELAAVDVPAAPATPAIPMVQAFIHSRDGTNWTVQDMSEVTGGTWATHMAGLGDRLYLVTGSYADDQFYRGSDQGWILTARTP